MQISGQVEPLWAGVRALREPLKIGLCVAFLVAVGSLFLQNQYTSVVRLLPKDPRGANGSLGSLAAAAAVFGVGGGGVDDAGAAYLDILKSRRVAEGLLTRSFRFSDKRWYFGAKREHQETLLVYLGAKNLDQGVRLMPDLLNSQRDMKSGLITLSATTPSPELSQQLVQAATRLLEDFIQVHSQSQAGAKAEFATERLAEAQKQALQTEDQLKQFLMANRNYASSSDPEVRLKGSRLESELQLRRQLVSTLAVSREQAILDQKDNTPILNVLDVGELPIEKSKPSRGLLVISAFIFGLAGTLVWQHWARLKGWLIEEK